MSLCLVFRFIYCYAECHYAQFRYAECRYVECRCAVIKAFYFQFLAPPTNVRLGMKWQQALTDLLLVDAAPDHEGDEAAELVLRDHPVVILQSNSEKLFSLRF